MERFMLKGEYITLGQLLKAQGMVENGVEAKLVIQDGEVLVNDEVERRRGRKLYPGDRVNFDGSAVEIFG